MEMEEVVHWSVWNKTIRDPKDYTVTHSIFNSFVDWTIGHKIIFVFCSSLLRSSDLLVKHFTLILFQLIRAI